MNMAIVPLGKLGVDGIEKTFERLQFHGLGGNGFDQLAARGGEFLKLVGQRGLARIVFLRGLVQREQLVVDGVEPLARSVGVARNNLEFAFLLCDLPFRFVEHAARLGHAGGERVDAGLQFFLLAARGGEAVFQRGDIFVAVGDQHAARKRAGNLTVRHPDLDAAVGVEHGTFARHHGATGGQRIGYFFQGIRKKNVTEQNIGGAREIGCNGEMRKQRRKIGWRGRRG